MRVDPSCTSQPSSWIRAQLCSSLYNFYDKTLENNLGVIRKCVSEVPHKMMEKKLDYLNANLVKVFHYVSSLMGLLGQGSSGSSPGKKFSYSCSMYPSWRLILILIWSWILIRLRYGETMSPVQPSEYQQNQREGGKLETQLRKESK